MTTFNCNTQTHTYLQRNHTTDCHTLPVYKDFINPYPPNKAPPINNEPPRLGPRNDAAAMTVNHVLSGIEKS